MKRLIPALAGLMALGWSALAAAQATSISTTCPTQGFICAFSAAESLSLVTPKTSNATPGQPDVYLGYISFDSGTTVTMTGMQNVNGSVGSIGSSTPPNPPVLTGTCAGGSNGQPATITFPTSSNKNIVLSFVKNSANTELQFILTQDVNSTSAGVANSVRVGVCRQQ